MSRLSRWAVVAAGLLFALLAGLLTSPANAEGEMPSDMVTKRDYCGTANDTYLLEYRSNDGLRYVVNDYRKYEGLWHSTEGQLHIVVELRDGYYNLHDSWTLTFTDTECVPDLPNTYEVGVLPCIRVERDMTPLVARVTNTAEGGMPLEDVDVTARREPDWWGTTGDEPLGTVYDGETVEKWIMSTGFYPGLYTVTFWNADNKRLASVKAWVPACEYEVPPAPVAALRQLKGPCVKATLDNRHLIYATPYKVVINDGAQPRVERFKVPGEGLERQRVCASKGATVVVKAKTETYEDKFSYQMATPFVTIK